MRYCGVGWCLVLLVAVLFLLPTFARAASQEDQQRTAAVDFLRHYLMQELSQTKEYLPTTKKAVFGPYPFTQPPVLSRPKVDNRQALVDFSAPVIDAAFLPKGGVLLYRDQGTWKVRQILFYRKVPALFRLPYASRTDADRAQEPTVQQIAEDFLQAWKHGKAAELLDHAYAWHERADDPVKGLHFNACSVSLTQTSWADSCAQYCAALSYKWGLLSYTFQLKGRLFLTKESGTWKVRGNVMVFDF
jgi:hypothetical protein